MAADIYKNLLALTDTTTVPATNSATPFPPWSTPIAAFLPSFHPPRLLCADASLFPQKISKLEVQALTTLKGAKLEEFIARYPYDRFITEETMGVFPTSCAHCNPPALSQAHHLRPS